MCCYGILNLFRVGFLPFCRLENFRKSEIYNQMRRSNVGPPIIRNSLSDTEPVLNCDMVELDHLDIFGTSSFRSLRSRRKDLLCFFNFSFATIFPYRFSSVASRSKMDFRLHFDLQVWLYFACISSSDGVLLFPLASPNPFLSVT